MPKSHTITIGEFTLEVGLDSTRVLLDLSQLLAALHWDYGQKEAEAKYAYAQANKLQAEVDRLRELCHQSLHALLSAGDALNWPDDVEDVIAGLRKALGR